MEQRHYEQPIGSENNMKPTTSSKNPHEEEQTFLNVHLTKEEPEEELVQP